MKAKIDIKNIEAYKLMHETAEIDYTITPRKSNLLHFIISGERQYQINGKKVTVGSNTLIFIPNNTRYKTVASPKCIGIGICFDGDIFKDEKDLDVYFKNSFSNPEGMKSLFEKILKLYDTIPHNFLEMKGIIIKILSDLTKVDFSEEYALIKDAIIFISEHYKENLPIKVYADKCSLSESYFRKKFKEFFGKSPIEYRNELRFSEAKRLYQNNVSTEKIAETLGFCDAGYMLKLYKSQTGKSLIKDAKII